MSASFSALGCSPPVVGALAARGIAAPFPIQQRVVPDALAGRDALVQAPTGSGKTLAFGLPLLERLAATDRRPAALVLAPTRELAGQIVEELAAVARARALAIAAVYGGVGIERQARAARRSHVLVATPGRLEDLIARGEVTLAHVRILVLDEADRMLDLGFRPAVERLVGATPADRQTLLFSATLGGEVDRVARAWTRAARRHALAPAADRALAIDHRFVAVEPARKVERLVRELRHHERGLTLVFVRTKRGADRLVRRLRGQHQVAAVAMHGDKTQGQRERALARFARGEVDVLVATDVAARGIDVRGVSHVINFDAPADREGYVHRVGRTGRAGATGVGVTFVVPDQARELARIARELGLQREFAQQTGFGPELAPAAGAAPRGPAARGGADALTPRRSSRRGGARRGRSGRAAARG